MYINYELEAEEWLDSPLENTAILAPRGFGRTTTACHLACQALAHKKQSILCSVRNAREFERMLNDIMVNHYPNLWPQMNLINVISMTRGWLRGVKSHLHIIDCDESTETLNLNELQLIAPKNMILYSPDSIHTPFLKSMNSVVIYTSEPKRYSGTMEEILTEYIDKTNRFLEKDKDIT